MREGRPWAGVRVAFVGVGRTHAPSGVRGREVRGQSTE